MVNFNLSFYDMIGLELVEVVNESHLQVKVVGASNTTFITLIPKGVQPKTFNDYRFISLCNFVYKIVTKTIANHLRSIMLRWMSKEKFGFLNNRHILDAIKVA